MIAKASLTAGLLSAVLLAGVTFSAPPARACGVIGCIVGAVSPQAGRNLDHFHEQLGKPLDFPGVVVPGVPLIKPIIALSTQPAIDNGEKAANNVVNNAQKAVNDVADRIAQIVGVAGDTMSHTVIEVGVVAAALMVLWFVLKIAAALLLFPLRKRTAA